MKGGKYMLGRGAKRMSQNKSANYGKNRKMKMKGKSVLKKKIIGANSEFLCF